jgi:hypothetical protein
MAEFRQAIRLSPNVFRNVCEAVINKATLTPNDPGYIALERQLDAITGNGYDRCPPTSSGTSK